MTIFLLQSQEEHRNAGSPIHVAENMSSNETQIGPSSEGKLDDSSAGGSKYMLVTKTQGSALAARHSVTAEGQPVTAEGHSATAEGRSVTAEGRPVTAEGRSVTAEGHSVTAERRPVTAEGRSVTAEGHSVTAEGRAVTADGRPVTADRTNGKLLENPKEVVADENQVNYADF